VLTTDGLASQLGRYHQVYQGKEFLCSLRVLGVTFAAQDQHSAYLRKELTAMRDRYITDTRIHCCLFFINPTGMPIRPLVTLALTDVSQVTPSAPLTLLL
jgi:hypothetical protein